MASICKRGDYQYQVIVRRKGYPSQTKTFETRANAQAWALDLESQMSQSVFRDRRELVKTTLSQALTRYMQCISPLKRGHSRETQRINRENPLAPFTAIMQKLVSRFGDGLGAGF